MVEEKLAFPKSVGEYFDSAHSPLNPYNRGNDTFVYGTFPIFLTKAIAAALHRRRLRRRRTWSAARSRRSSTS